MKTKWTDCSTLQELAAAQARGDEIDVYVRGEWSIWDETVWNEREEYRCRPAQPKIKTITLRKALLRDSDGRYYTSDGSCSRKSDRFFVCWLGDPYIVNVPK